jgi:hypothetical protein
VKKNEKIKEAEREIKLWFEKMFPETHSITARKKFEREERKKYEQSFLNR